MDRLGYFGGLEGECGDGGNTENSGNRWMNGWVGYVRHEGGKEGGKTEIRTDGED